MTTTTCTHNIRKITNIAFDTEISVCKACGACITRPALPFPYTGKVECIDMRTPEQIHKAECDKATAYVNGMPERFRPMFQRAWARRRNAEQAEMEAFRTEPGACNYPRCEDCELDMLLMHVPNHAEMTMACPECGISETEQEWNQLLADQS